MKEALAPQAHHVASHRRRGGNLVEAALKGQREAIAARLADYRSSYVGQVKFPPPPATAARRLRGGATRAARRPKVVKFRPGKDLLL